MRVRRGRVVLPHLGCRERCGVPWCRPVSLARARNRCRAPSRSPSQWARNPIPRIWDSKKGLHDPEACPGPSAVANPKPGCLAFPAPCPWDTYAQSGFFKNCTTPKDGNRLHKCDGDSMGECSSDWVVGVVSDHVIIPAELPPGEYVLGWRWDCEETAQIWQNCADVTVVAP